MHLNETWAIVITALPALLVITSGLFKLTGNKAIVEGLTKMGVIQYLRWLGIAEIVFAILFVFPVTNSIGFILLVCYFSGALATDLSHQSKVAAPMIILGILFIAEFFAYPGMFF